MIDHTITDENLHLIDSYKVSKKDFSKELNDIKEHEPDYQVWNRCIPQMCLEWAVHNAAYALNIKREQARHVDLDYPQSFIEKIGYTVCGILVWLFIK